MSKSPLAQSSHLLGNPVVVGVEVEGAQDGAVAALPAALRAALRGRSQRARPAAPRRRTRRPRRGTRRARRRTRRSGRHGRRRNPGCTGPGPALEKSTCTGSTSGWAGSGKVDGDDVAHAGSHLVHQTAGLAKVDILRPLADLCDGDGGDLFGHEAVVQDHADQHLKGGRGRNAAALGHVGSRRIRPDRRALHPAGVNASHSPRSRDMVVFSSSLRAARSARSMTHRS